MAFQNGLIFQSFAEFWDYLPEDQRIIADVLRQIVLENLPKTTIEKLHLNVPYYFGNKRICMIWPACIKGGGIKSGVLFGFSKGNQLVDEDQYLTHGTNKRIFYKIYKTVEEIDESAIIKLLHDAVEVDKRSR